MRGEDWKVPAQLSRQERPGIRARVAFPVRPERLRAAAKATVVDPYSPPPVYGRPERMYG